MVAWEHKPSIQSAPWIAELIRAHTGLMPSDADEEIDAAVFKPGKGGASSLPFPPSFSFN
jgi:hypothetical protein